MENTLVFAKHLSSAAKICLEREKAKDDLEKHLAKMRRSVINLSISYTDIDRLKHNVENAVHLEQQYSRFFKAPDNESAELRSYINELESELRKERFEKKRIKEENNEKISKLSESLESIKHQMRTLLMEKSKKTQRMLALEKKIREKAGLHHYSKHH